MWYLESKYLLLLLEKSTTFSPDIMVHLMLAAKFAENHIRVI